MTSKENVLAKWEDYYRDNPPAHVDDLKAQMLRLSDGQLYRALSIVPNAGLGLFSAVPLREGQLVTWYSGAYVTKQEYEALKATDRNYRDYAMTLDLGARQIVLGNYKRNSDGRLVKVDYADLATVFANNGALQFANGQTSMKHPQVNVGHFSILGRDRVVPKGVSLTMLPDVMNKLSQAHPDEILHVGVALKDLPAGTEIILSYGNGYFQQQMADQDDSDDDDDLSNSLDSDSDETEPPTKKRRFRCVICKHQWANWMCGKCQTTYYCSKECQRQCDAEGHCSCRV